MRTIIKFLSYAFAFISLLLLVGIVLLVAVVSPNNFKDEIAQAFYSQTHLKLKLDGDLNWSFYPVLGISLNNASVYKAGHITHPIATVQQGNIQVEIKPLLNHRLRIAKLHLNHLTLNLTPTTLLTTKSTAKQAGKQASDKNYTLASCSISHLSLAAVTFNYENKGKKYQLTNLSLDANTIAPNNSFPVSFAFDSTLSHARIKVTGKTSFKLTDQTIQANDTHLTGHYAIHGQQNRFNYQGDISYNWRAKHLHLQDFAAAINQLKATGQLKVDLDHALSLNAKLSLSSFNAEELLQAHQISLPNSINPKLLQKTAGTLDLNYSHHTLRIDKAACTLGNLPITLSGKINFDKNTYQASLTLENIQLADLLNTSPHNATTVSPPSTTKPTQVSTPLTHFTGVSHITIQQFKFQQLEADNVAFTLSQQGRQFRIKPLTADFYDGDYKGDVSLQLQPGANHITLNETLSNVPSAKLFELLAWQTTKVSPSVANLLTSLPISGTGKVAIKLATVGKSSSAYLKNLSGLIHFRFDQGALSQFDADDLMTLAIAHLQHRHPQDAVGTEQTDFSVLEGTLNLNQGMVTNDDLLLQSPVFLITGQGSASLIEHQVQYHLELKRALKANQTNQYSNLIVPVHISGPLTSPAITLDTQRLLHHQLRRHQQRYQHKVEKELEKSVGKKTLKKLKSRFGLEKLFN